MRVIIAVDYAGAALRLRHPSVACKALRGCSGRRGRAVGALADLSVFSLYQVKAMTNGEGGVITTERFEAAYQMRSFRNHGITSDHFERAQQGSWLYEMVDLYNYRLNGFQCVLGTQPCYRERFGPGPGLCANAEAAYEKILSRHIFPGMDDEDVDDAIEALWKIIGAYAIGRRTAAFAAAR